MKSIYIPIPQFKQSFEGVRYTGTNKSEILDLLNNDKTKIGTLENGDLLVRTSEQGFQSLTIGQFVLKYPNEQIAIRDASLTDAYMTAPIAVEAEFEKQKKQEAEKEQRQRDRKDALFVA